MVKNTIIGLLLFAMLAWTPVAFGKSDKGSSSSFTGVVNADDVYVRARPGSYSSNNYYWVTRLSKGAILEVNENLIGWYRIESPEGTFSYISKAYVETSGDGSDGTVTGDRVRVRAPSPAGPEKSYKIQLKVNQNDKVQIIGETGGFYKIVPPQGAYLYIHKDYVDVATAEDIAGAEVAVKQEEDDAGQVIQEEVVVEDTESDQADTSVIVETVEFVEDVEIDKADQADASDRQGDVSEFDKKLADLEQIFAEESGKPLTEQSLEQMVKDYQQLLAEAGLSDQTKALINTRLEVINTRIQLRHAQLALAHAEKQIAQQQSVSDSGGGGGSVITVGTVLTSGGGGDDQQAVIAQPVGTVPAASYSAVGKLQTSILYTGEKLPLLYRLVDSLSGLTIAYVEPLAGQKFNDQLGLFVGIVGQSRYDDAMKLKIITVDQIDVLAAAPGS